MQAVLDLVGEIYEASMNPKHWDQVVSALCDVTQSRSGAIFVEDHDANIRSMIGAHGLPAAVKTSYRFGMSRYDHTFQLQRQENTGQPRQIIEARQIRRDHPFYYRLILKPNDIGYIAGMNIYQDGEWHVGIGLHRPFSAPPFADDELQVLTWLFPHFQRALRIHKEFHRVRSEKQTLQAALNRFMIGLIILHPDGNVSHCNPVATALLRQHQGLQLTGNRIRAYWPTENHALQDMIRQLASTAPQEISSRNLALGLTHPDNEHALNVMLAPLDHGGDDFNRVPPGSVALYLSDPSSPFNLPAETLQSLYGMTPAEARVAIALVNGQSPKYISQQHGVSVETVRSQLKNIYAKMGVKKQQDVIRILLTGAIA